MVQLTKKDNNSFMYVHIFFSKAEESKRLCLVNHIGTSIFN